MQKILPGTTEEMTGTQPAGTQLPRLAAFENFIVEQF